MYIYTSKAAAVMNTPIQPPPSLVVDAVIGSLRRALLPTFDTTDTSLQQPVMMLSLLLLLFVVVIIMIIIILLYQRQRTFWKLRAAFCNTEVTTTTTDHHHHHDGLPIVYWYPPNNNKWSSSSWSILLSPSMSQPPQHPPNTTTTSSNSNIYDSYIQSSNITNVWSRMCRLNRMNHLHWKQHPHHHPDHAVIHTAHPIPIRDILLPSSSSFRHQIESQRIIHDKSGFRMSIRRR